MKAFLLAMGEKNPLEAMAPSKPSPMVPLLNRPVMQYSVDLLYQNGIRDIYVNLYHFGEQIEQSFGSGERWRVNLKYLLQNKPLGTAGTIRRAKYHIDDTFIVLPADLLIHVDLTAALAYHRENGNIATVILQSSPNFPTDSSGTVSLTPNGSVLAVGESAKNRDGAKNESYYNSGVYIFEPDILTHIPPDVRYECDLDLLPALLEASKVVSGYVNDGYWNPLDTFSAYQHAQSTLFGQLTGNGIATSDNQYIHASQGPTGVWHDKNTYTHPSALIRPPVYVGTGSQLLANSEIGPNVVVGPYVVVGSGTSIKNSTVLESTLVGQLLDIEHKIVNTSHLIDTKRDEVVHVSNSSVLTDINPSLLSNLLAIVIEKSICLFLFFLNAPFMVLMGLLTIIATGGQIFTKVERIGSKPKSLLNPSLSEPQTLKLTHFQTRLTNGDYTKIGQWMEQWEINRLPELWSVLIGELSLVGVQPLSFEEANLITEEWQTQRYKCRAGFTGFWYTQTAPDSDLIERCMVDVYYTVTQCSSTWLMQLLYTPKMWLLRKLVHADSTGYMQQRNVEII